MEMSVGFADKGKDANYYIERGYRVEESELGKVYYPKRKVVKVGKIGIRYEERPWLSSFEIDGLRPAKPRGKNYSRSMQLILQYARAFDGIRRKDVIDLCKFSPSQSSKLLRRIVDGGYLEARGAGRATRYVLTEEGKKYR